MVPPRIPEERIDSSSANGVQPAAFLLVSAPPAVPESTSSMQSFYQRLYEEALKACTPTPNRDLFAVMN